MYCMVSRLLVVLINHDIGGGPLHHNIHRGGMAYHERSMGLAKKLIVCKECGAKNPDYALECGSCASALRIPPAKDSCATRERRTSDGLVDSTYGHRADDRKPIWQTRHRNRAALNLFLVALFAFILISNLLSGASAFYIAVVLVFLVLSTTRFLLTWRMIRREHRHSSSMGAE